MSISTCWRCGGRIHAIRHRWTHKETGLPFSTLNGDHMASPFPPPDPDAVPERPETAG